MPSKKYSVYVVAWEYNGGGGFNWYNNPKRADKAFEEEKRNANNPDFARDGWTAFRFDVKVKSDPSRVKPGGNTDNAVSREIDIRLTALTDLPSTIRYRKNVKRKPRRSK